MRCWTLGFGSTSTAPITMPLPSIFEATFLRVGASCLQCPHLPPADHQSRYKWSQTRASQVALLKLLHDASFSIAAHSLTREHKT